MNLATLADRNLDEHGVYDRLVFEERTLTNRDLHEASCRLARALLDLGLEPGDRVVVVMPNAPEVLVGYAGVWRAGLVVVPVLFVLEAAELRYILEASSARAVLTSPDAYAKVAQAAGGLARPPLVLVTGEAAGVPAGSVSYEERVRASAPLREAVDRAGSDLATILFTSGTTGRPKGVMQTHANLLANAENSWRSSPREPGEMSLLVLPLAHTFGLGVLISGYLSGGRAVLMRWFDAERALALIERHRVRTMAGVPTMFVYMMTHPNARQYDTSSVERWLVGAAPMPAEQMRRFEETFGGTLHMGYGLSEACPGVAAERVGMPRKPGSTGTVLEGVTVKIVDDIGHELPRGEIGEICVKGANVSPGYYGDAEATAESFRGGWLHTGDVGKLDDDGYLFILERKKDLVIRGGLNIYPKDVEEIVRQHAAVADVAVVGVPDEVMGEEVCAFVVPKPGADVTPDAIATFCQERLAKYKTPRFVEIVSALPRTTIGKVQKKELRRIAAAKYAR
jgi:long-chain acyl-CoA synthetase